LGDSLETAWLEVKAHAGEARANIRAFRAWRVVLPAAPAREIVDLRDRDQRRRHGITQAELEADPAPESGKALARRLRGTGKASIIYHSVRNRPGGVCAAVFLEGIEADLSVEPVDDEWARFVEREEVQ